jgi:hypothetical protein
MEELSADQLEILKRFIEEADKEEVESARFQVESVDSACLRFLKGRQFDLGKAKLLLHEAFQKKQEYNVAELIRRPAEENSRCDIAAMKNWYPHSMPGFDKQNRPILFEHTGGITPSVLSVMTTKEWLVSYHWWSMENLLNQSFREAKERSESMGLPMSFTTCVILDFAGLNSTHCSKAMLDHVKGLVAIDNICYPEILGKMLVINAPWLVHGLWTLVKGWIHPVTQAKIEILPPGPETINKLLEYIDADKLPAAYNGNSYGGNGPPIHQDKPDTENIYVPRGGHMRRVVYVPASHQLCVDSYIADGTVDIVISAADCTDPNSQKTVTPVAVSGAGTTQGAGLVKHSLAGNNGIPTRFFYECPLSDKDSLVTIVWGNTSRFTTRSVVYTLSLNNCSLDCTHSTPSLTPPPTPTNNEPNNIVCDDIAEASRSAVHAETLEIAECNNEESAAEAVESVA